MQSWLFLFGAIAAEVIGTTALKATHGFTRLAPSVVVVAAYALAFYLLSRTMQTIPMSISYAVWSGVGIVLITLIG
ncbi:MAG: multidrug efflux SMR transporter, partial [Thiomonas sp.]